MSYLPTKGYVGTLYPYGGFSIGYSNGETKPNKSNRIKKNTKEYQDRRDYEIIFNVTGFNRDDYPDSIIDYLFSEQIRKLATAEQLERAFDAYYRIFQKDLERQWKSIPFDWSTRFPDGSNPDYDCCQDYPFEFAVRGESSKTALPSLGLSSVTISRTRKGLKGISRRGTHSVKSGCYLLEKAYRGRLGLGTITIPRLSELDRRTLHDNWGDFTNRLIERIRRELNQHGCKADDMVAVTEIQEKRLVEYDELYLHLHFVYVCRQTNRRSDNGWFLDKSKLPEIVSEQIENCLNRAYSEMGIDCRFNRFSIDWSASCRVEVVKKSCVGYLGKYMSKGAKTLREIDDKHRESFPYQWWYVSRMLKEAVRAGTYRLSVDVCSVFMDKLAWMQSEGLLPYLRIGNIPINEDLSLLCICGALSYRGKRYIMGLIENIRERNRVNVGRFGYCMGA